MYKRTLPGLPEAADKVRSWARSTASRHRPELADRCERVVSRLVANAVPRTPKDGVIAVTITPSAGRLRVEVHDPGEPVGGDEKDEWSEVSELTPWYGSSRTRNGHVTWAELKGPAP
ncbi:hypothetical protein GCM10027612_86620 [Microbispora bryophytorum subsp. camponoti]